MEVMLSASEDRGATVSTTWSRPSGLPRLPARGAPRPRPSHRPSNLAADRDGKTIAYMGAWSKAMVTLTARSALPGRACHATRGVPTGPRISARSLLGVGPYLATRGGSDPRLEPAPTSVQVVRAFGFAAATISDSGARPARPRACRRCAGRRAKSWLWPPCEVIETIARSRRVPGLVSADPWAEASRPPSSRSSRGSRGLHAGLRGARDAPGIPRGVYPTGYSLVGAPRIDFSLFSLESAIIPSAVSGAPGRTPLNLNR